MKKKALAILLAVLLVVALLPSFALAAGPDINTASNWVADRTEPGDFAISGGNITFTVTENPAADSWYAWQGRGFFTGAEFGGEWSVEYDIVVTDAMLTTDNINASVWIQIDEDGGNTAASQADCVDWCIVKYSKEDAAPAWQWWDSINGTWNDIAGVTPTAGTHTVKISFKDGTVTQSIDGTDVNDYSVGVTEAAPVYLIVMGRSYGDSFGLTFGVPEIVYPMFQMEDFGLWGAAYPGWYNVGWRYAASFDVTTITGIEVGLCDASGALIVKYTADADQLAFQASNGYITAAKQSSAPFSYTIEEIEDDDWTVTYGPAADKWQVAACYVTVTTSAGKTWTGENAYAHTHVYDQEIVRDGALKSAATYSSPAIYYKSCIDGAVGDTETFEYGDPLPLPPAPPAPVTYALTFATDGGTEIPALSVTAGTVVDLADYAPEKDGFTFAGWFADEALTEAVTSVTVTAAKTVYAKWDKVPCDGGEDCVSHPYADVDTAAWYHEAVDYVIENGLMQGIGDGKFDPLGVTTRAQLVMTLYRLEGEPAAAFEPTFNDVAESDWYADAVMWANSTGIACGYGNGEFGAEDALLREQAAVILYRYAVYKGLDVSVDPNTNFLSFNDFWDVSDYATAAMEWALTRGIIEGYDWDILPQGDAIRVQTAAMLFRFCENVL